MRADPKLKLLLLAAAFVVGACASTGGTQAAPFATLVIHNDGASIVTIYTTRDGGSRLRLGQVSPMSQAEFSIRHNMVSGGSQLQVLIAPMGSRQTYPSNPIHVNEGDVLELRVSSFLR